MPPCTPEELERIVDGIVDNKIGETTIQHLNLEQDLEPPSSTGESLRRMQMGSFSSIRTVRAALGDTATAAFHNDLVRTVTRMNNSLADAYKKLNEGFQHITETGSFIGDMIGHFRAIPVAKDQELFKAMEMIDKGGKWIGNPSTFKKEIQDSAVSLRNTMDSLYDNFIATDPLLNKVVPNPTQYLHGYMPHMLRKQNKGMFWLNEAPNEAEKTFMSKLSPENIRWFHEHERLGGMTNIEDRASVALQAYVNSMMRAKFIKPELQRIEKDIINPTFGVKLWKGKDGLRVMVNDPVGYMYWKEYTHYLMGGATSADIRRTGQLNKLLNNFGYKTDARGLYFTSHMLSSIGYAGTMGAPIIGGRPASVIRQFFQLIPTWADQGTKHATIGVKRAIEDLPAGIELKRLMDKGFLTSHIDNLIQTMDVARNAGRYVSHLVDGMMKTFAFTDRFVRIATALSAESKFNEAVTKGIETLSAGREIKQEIIKRFNLGRVEDARDLYVMDTLSNLQYIYGKANRPELLRGALGNLTGMFMSYPLNTFEMMRKFTKRAFTDESGKVTMTKGDWMPLARLMTATVVATEVGSEMLDADVRQSMFFGALPHALLVPKAAADVWSAGNSSAEWLTGNLFGVGMSNYARQQMSENYREASKGLMSFLPGYGAYNDFSKVLDEGYYTRLLGLTPKAEILDQLAKQRMREKRMESGRTPGLGGF